MSLRVIIRGNLEKIVMTCKKNASLRGTKQSQTIQIGFAKLLCKLGIASCLAMTIQGYV